MPAFLTFDSLAAATPDRQPLFTGLTLSIGAERVGLVGRNGSGKSTLLRIGAGLAEPAAGTAVRSGSVGLLAQDWPPDLTLAEVLGVDEALALLARIVAGQGSEADFAAADWTLETRIEAALADGGLSNIALKRRIATLSGGERTRIGIVRLLIDAPDLLLLDEPTNYLDAAGRAAIHALVTNWRGGVLVASHDRALLEAMDRIVELTPIGVRIVGGGWSAFAAARDAECAHAAAERDRADAALRDARRAAQQQREAKERRDKTGRTAAAKGSEPRIVLGNRARQAEESGGRARQIGDRLIGDAAARAKAARTRIEVLTPIAIALPPSGLPSTAAVLAIEAATVTVGDRRLGPWTVTLTGPERVAVTGSNGAGKTTLLRLAAGSLEPSGGTARRTHGGIVMLDEHVTLLDPASTILANFRRLNPGLDDNAARAACARFAFRNRDALQEVGTLSGGERLRAGLACTLAGEHPPWLLILDEPTNHLDIDSIEILEAAFSDYDGALLVVSHDAAFLAAIGVDRTLDLGAAERP